MALLSESATLKIVQILWDRVEPRYETAIGLSLYVTLGIMLLIAVRSPSAYRSVIAFTAWSSFAHGFVMATMVVRDSRSRDEGRPRLSWLSLA